jgi:hypothetical protein
MREINSNAYYSTQLFNLLKTKRYLLYIRNQFVPRCKHFPTWFKKTNQLMTYTAKFVVFSEIRIKHSTQSEKHAEFFNIKPGGTLRNCYAFNG